AARPRRGRGDPGLRLRSVPSSPRTREREGGTPQRGGAADGRHRKGPDVEAHDPRPGRAELGHRPQTGLRDFREDSRAAERRLDGPHGRTERVPGPSDRGFRIRHAGRPDRQGRPAGPAYGLGGPAEGLLRDPLRTSPDPETEHLGGGEAFKDPRVRGSPWPNDNDRVNQAAPEPNRALART